MEKYKILMEINRKLVFGEEISDKEKEENVSILLDGISSKEDVIRYKRRMRVNSETEYMYPDYYIPPYNGNKKLRLVQGYLPKTNILYANHYELEIIRLLCMFAPKDAKINEMVEEITSKRQNADGIAHKFRTVYDAPSDGKTYNSKKCIDIQSINDTIELLSFKQFFFVSGFIQILLPILEVLM